VAADRRRILTAVHLVNKSAGARALRVRTEIFALGSRILPTLNSGTPRPDDDVFYGDNNRYARTSELYTPFRRGDGEAVLKRDAR